MYLLREFSDQIEVLTENTTEGRVLYLEGPHIQTEAQNRNKRIYTKKVMEPVVEKYVNDYIKERRAIGELNHPADRPFADPRHAAIMCESLTWQGNNVVGKSRVLNTPDGLIIKALMEAKFKMGVSTRGLGKVNKANGLVEAYLLNAIDAVDMPSGQTCYVNAINESTEWQMTNEGVWIEKVNAQKAADIFMDQFERLMFNIKGKK